MKAHTYFMILLLFLLNNYSIGTSEIGIKHNLNFKIDHSTKHDSIAFIPKTFLEFQKNSRGFCLVHGNSTKKQIALTFDDGPTEVTSKIVDILNKYNAKATFFWVGERLKENSNVIQYVKESGHTIANHSWNHDNGLSFSNQVLWEKQVQKCHLELSKQGIDSKFYRPPFGAITQEQIDFLAKKNIKTVLWSITTMDWDNNQNTDNQMYQKFKKNIHNGAIVLMHDVDFGNLESKLNDLEKILIYGTHNGYQFVNIEDVL